MLWYIIIYVHALEPTYLPNSKAVRNSTTKALTMNLACCPITCIHFLKGVHMTLTSFRLPHLNINLFKYKYYVIMDLEIYIKLIDVYVIYEQKCVLGEMHGQKYKSLINMIKLLWKMHQLPSLYYADNFFLIWENWACRSCYSYAHTH